MHSAARDRRQEVKIRTTKANFLQELGTTANRDKLGQTDSRAQAFFVHVGTGLQGMQSSHNASRGREKFCMPSSGREATQGRTKSAGGTIHSLQESCRELPHWEVSGYKPHPQAGSPQTQLQVHTVRPALKVRKPWAQITALAADRCTIEVLTPGPLKEQ